MDSSETINAAQMLQRAYEEAAEIARTRSTDKNKNKKGVQISDSSQKRPLEVGVKGKGVCIHDSDSSQKRRPLDIGGKGKGVCIQDSDSSQKRRPLEVGVKGKGVCIQDSGSSQKRRPLEVDVKGKGVCIQDSDSSQKRRPLEVDVKEKRVRLAPECGETIFKLCKALGHRSGGQTVEWLLNQAKAPVEAALSQSTNTTTTKSRPPSLPLPPPPPPLAPPVVNPHSYDPLPALPPLPPLSPPVIDLDPNDDLLLHLPPPALDPNDDLFLPLLPSPVADPHPSDPFSMALVIPSSPPAPPAVDRHPSDPFSLAPVIPPPPATIVPTFNQQLPSAPILLVVAGDNPRMPVPVVRPKPVLASRGRRSRHNRAGDQVEITADAVARFLYGPRSRG